MLLFLQVSGAQTLGLDKDALLAQLMPISTSMTYNATLHYVGGVKFKCTDTTNSQIVAVDSPTIYIQIIKRQTNSVIAIVDKSTGERYYARVTARPILVVKYETNELSVAFALFKGANKRRLLYTKLNELIAKMAKWSGKVEAHGDAIIRTYKNDETGNQVRVASNQQGTSLQFSSLETNGTRAVIVDLRVQPSSIEDFKPLVNVADEKDLQIDDVDEKHFDRFNAIFCILLMRDLLKTSKPELYMKDLQPIKTGWKLPVQQPRIDSKKGAKLSAIN